ncbi:MAG TPA: non-canonical purine NTP pyrophosphatase [archaeon]|nr:non-canonical purine NTP pyrophosphatase [archaeon]
MKKIYFATSNKGKFNFVAGGLLKNEIEAVQVSLEIPEPRSDDVRQIVKEKVLFAYGKLKKPCIAMDGGFFVYSLNGFPKAFVNFVLETIEVDGILKLVDGKPRGCEFRNCIAYMDKKLKKPMFFEHRAIGTLSRKSRGKMQPHMMSPLSLYFIPESQKKTIAQMSFEENQKVVGWDIIVSRLARFLKKT